jgi:rSAM/selenodomain-associated transferase 2
MKLFLGQRWFSWPRLAALLLTTVLLWVVVWQIDLAALLKSTQRLQFGWVALAALSYALAVMLGGLRWHLALKLTDATVHPAASCRSAWVGHFFFVFLFGVVGGDLGKSAIYARWYRFPLSQVVAAARFDRVFGAAGPLLLLGLLGGLAWATGGLEEFPPVKFGLPGIWLWIVPALILAGLVMRRFWPPANAGAWARALRASREGFRGLRASPAVAVRGLLVALLAHLALSAVFALNLEAVSGAPLPWVKLAWTLPVITAISCLPFTVAGAGAREVAALAFLGIYGVPAADCVAASWLTLAQKVALAGVGAAIFWREEMLLAKLADRPLPRSISVVIPVLNEAEALPETLRCAQAVSEASEIIVVDGGSRDGAREVAGQSGAQVLESPPGRGGQMRLGAQHATGDVVLLLHADTWLPAHAGRAALNCLRDPSVAAGGFWKTFRGRRVMLLGSRWRCAVRLFAGRRILGDQAIFIRRAALEQIGGVPDVPLMEEFELCRRLRRVGRLALAGATVVTSARRFQRLGILRTYWRMWRVSALYRLGVPPEKLRRIYESD